MKCEHCKSDMVWEGSMQSGGMVCRTCQALDLAEAILTGYDEGVSMPDPSAKPAPVPIPPLTPSQLKMYKAIADAMAGTAAGEGKAMPNFSPPPADSLFVQYECHQCRHKAGVTKSHLKRHGGSVICSVCLAVVRP